MKKMRMIALILCAVFCFAAVSAFAGEFFGSGKSGGKQGNLSYDDWDGDEDGEIEVQSNGRYYQETGNPYYAPYLNWSSGNYVRSGDLIYEIDAGSGYASVFSCNPNARSVSVAASAGGYPVDRIGACAFAGCTRLQYVSFPATVEIIASGAFRGCESLTEVDLPEKLTALFASAFENCLSLNKVTIHAKTAVIGDYAFAGCESLRSLKIPNCVTMIFTHALPDTTAVVCKQGSYAESWAIKYNHDYRYTGNVTVSSITLNSDKKTLKISSGETPSYQLTAEIRPAEVAGTALKWKSSDKSVATVKNGLVQAVAPGKATITCTADDEGGVSATCVITVKAVAVESFKVVKENTTEDLAGTTLSLKAGAEQRLQVIDIQPANAVNTNVTWKSSDKSVVKVTSSGRLVAVSKGKARITVTSDDGNCTVTFTVRVK